MGARLDYSASPATTFSYYNFIGKENVSRNLRFFHGVGVKSTLGRKIVVQANADYGMQDKELGGTSRWYSFGLIGKAQPNPRLGVSARVEEFRDAEQVVIVTGSEAGFRGTTASLGADVTPLGSTRAMWRTEVRGTWNTDPVFPRRSNGEFSKNNYLLVSSFAVTF